MFAVNHSPRRFAVAGVLMLVFTSTGEVRAQDDADPPEIVVGERLFLETRFAQYFALHADSPNAPLDEGDPVMDFTVTTTGNLKGPYRGESMNCRACHLVDELKDDPKGTMRTYADFAQRSPIPERNDGKRLTLRNSPAQVNASVDREFLFFHFDAEFIAMEDLVIETFSGRNFGWLSGEEAQAIAHIAHIIREDNGTFPLSAAMGGAYKVILKGTDPGIPPEYQLPEVYRIDVEHASDQQILDAIARLVAAYVTDLSFNSDDEGYDYTPYDVFLRKNSLPVMPGQNEAPVRYARRLRDALEQLTTPQFVAPSDAPTGPSGEAFQFHLQEFRFGETELAGLKTFLREGDDSDDTPDSAEASIGNCMACHAPPHFSDFLFHNTGAAQEEYDAVHGEDAFAGIDIPELSERQPRRALYLPLQAGHLTAASGQFADIPALSRPGHTDLGLWNVFLNPTFPKPQNQIRTMLQRQYPGLSDAELLRKTIATFKTPGLRDLGHSQPYLHTGRFSSLEDSLRFYIRFSELARNGTVRNADSELGKIYLVRKDIAPLAAFLRSLNEDYE